MKVLLFGATGMVGSGVLIECLEDPQVTAVLSVGRTALQVKHPKLAELIQKDLFDVASMADRLRGFDACFFCLGVSAAGMTEAEYTHLTYDLTIGIARELAAHNLQMTFTYVSGEGTDRTGKSRYMWARVKGRTENDLLTLPFRAFAFRPGMIQPMKGVKTKTGLYAAIYALATPFYPVLRALFPTHITTSVNVGRAMIRVAGEGHSTEVLENVAINALGEPPKI